MPDMDWRDVVKADVESLPTAKARSAGGALQITSDMMPGVHRLLVKAAMDRRLSLSAYVRRATMAMIAQDLGRPLAELVTMDPRMSRETGYPIRDDDGTAFGVWEIAALVQEEEQGD